MPSPPPCEPRRTEVLLKRLLLCCEQAAVSSGGVDWARSPQAQFDVDAAQDLVTQLTAAGCAASHVWSMTHTPAVRLTDNTASPLQSKRQPVSWLCSAHASPACCSAALKAARLLACTRRTNAFCRRSAPTGDWRHTGCTAWPQEATRAWR